LETRFDEPGAPSTVDVEMAGRVITADSAQGTVTIVFDDKGQLKSLDIS
jgi:hypothetical protein